MAEFKDQKRPLGRGLGSLLGGDLSATEEESQPVAATTAAPVEKEIPDDQRIWTLDIEWLAPNLYQPRKEFVAEKIKELSQSVKEKGILQPIVARKISHNNYEIIAGERRWRAAQLAGLQKVPVILKEVRNQESLELALIENIQRHDLNPIEEAEAYQKLADEFDLSQEEISKKVGKERATVANCLRLLGLSPEVKQMLVNGELTAGHGKALLVLTDPAKQRELAKRITSERLTVRAAEKLVQGVQQRRKDLDEPRGESGGVNIAANLVKGLQEDLIKKLQTKVEISYQKGQGAINIKFYNDEDLTRIIDQIKS